MKRSKWLKFVAVAMIACATTAFAAETATPQPAPIKANPKSKVYHKSGCRFYNAKGNTVEFKTEAAAVKAGYKPCKLCAAPKPKDKKDPKEKKADEQAESSGSTE